jgi:hypothetical protein
VFDIFAHDAGSFVSRCCEFVAQKQKTRSTALAVGGLEIRL